jgi:hypothetical protein
MGIVAGDAFDSVAMIVGEIFDSGATVAGEGFDSATAGWIVALEQTIICM